jgi:hypothetical protein
VSEELACGGVEIKTARGNLGWENGVVSGKGCPVRGRPEATSTGYLSLSVRCYELLGVAGRSERRRHLWVFRVFSTRIDDVYVQLHAFG